MANAVSQRVATNLQHPPDDNSMPTMQQNKKRVQTYQETQLPKAKKARSQTERIEGIALTEYYEPGETVIPPDDKWKLMGEEWLKNLEEAKPGAALYTSVRTKGSKLKYKMHLAPTEGQTMWVLRHPRLNLDALMRKCKS